MKPVSEALVSGPPQKQHTQNCTYWPQTTADAPSQSSYVRANALNSSHPRDPKRRTPLKNNRPKISYSTKYTQLIPRNLPSPVQLCPLRCSCVAQFSVIHDPSLSLCITCPLLQTAVIYSKTVLKSSSEKSSTISKAVIFFIFSFRNQTRKLLGIFSPPLLEVRIVFCLQTKQLIILQSTSSLKGTFITCSL